MLKKKKEKKLTFSDMWYDDQRENEKRNSNVETSHVSD